MDDRDIRAALDRHWAASDASDFEAEHEIYREDAVLDYPQSGERIRGQRKIQASRAAQPNHKRFTVRRITGTGDLWITEYVLTYDGRPSYTVSIMEFREGRWRERPSISPTPSRPDRRGRNGSNRSPESRRGRHQSVAGREWCSCTNIHRPSIFRKPMVSRKSRSSFAPSFS